MEPDTNDSADQPQAERAPRDNRAIVAGVQVMDGNTLRTFAASTEAEHDALEALLTPAQVERLRESGAITGDWHGKGKPAAPMPGSAALRAQAGAGTNANAEVQALRAENARLRHQLAAGSAAAADVPPAETDDETPAEEQKRGHGRGRHHR